MLTFQCAACGAAFADLGLFWRHIEVRHGIPVRAQEPRDFRSGGAERVRAWRERQKEVDPEFYLREKWRVRAYRQGGRSGA